METEPRDLACEEVLNRYFEPLRPGVSDVPADILRFLKNEPERSIQNALRYMAEAAEGRGSVRAAVAVASNGDGTFTVVDGNATTHALARLGIPRVRVCVVGENTGSRLLNSALMLSEMGGPAELLPKAAPAPEAWLDDTLHSIAEKANARTERCGSEARVYMPDDSDYGDVCKLVRRLLPPGAEVTSLRKIGTPQEPLVCRELRLLLQFAEGGAALLRLLAE